MQQGLICQAMKIRTEKKREKKAKKVITRINYSNCDNRFYGFQVSTAERLINTSHARKEKRIKAV